jgi:hypothetical protein
MAVSGTKEMLESQNMMDFVEDINVMKKTFTAEDGRAVDYNQLVIRFANGDDLTLKLDKSQKVTVYYTLKEGKKAV